MKNRGFYVGNSFEFYKTVCSKKRNLPLLHRLALLDPEIMNLFTTYDHYFDTDQLQLLVTRGYISPEKDDLKELYEYDSATLRSLKDELTTTPTGRSVKCQQCTINDVNTFDHLVPQGEFAEFIVHPRNLICCCGDCNGRKSTNWRNAHRRNSLNLYLDILPDLQYLFVEAEIGNEAIDVEYKLENPNGVDGHLFALITDHYTKLDLFRRFKLASDTVITSFRNSLTPMIGRLEVPTIREVVLESIAADRIAHGFNYWQCVLKETLVLQDDFMIDFE